MTPTTEYKRFDSLIIGSGLAGLLAAYELANQGQSVALVSKGLLVESNTSWAQGGLAAVTEGAFLDSPETHLQDTLKSGAGLTDELTARLIIWDGAKLIERLCGLGVIFDTKYSGFDLALEGGHCRPRVLHCKDTTGRSITTALAQRVATHQKITVLENTAALDLIVQDNKCMGAYFLSDNQITSIFAKHTVLASGGVGQLFARTTNPSVATGDGMAIAYRAGAALADMEFVQFHPTALSIPKAPAFLISEAVRGAGAVLLDEHSEPFMQHFHKDAELATRDIVARAIHTTIKKQKKTHVYLDMRPIGIEKLVQRFPHIINNCRKWGVDPLIQPVPVAPAAHYFMGGILTNVDGQTSIENLFAIGECAANGLHGANRLASNSLLEAGVMSMRVSQMIAGNVSQPTKTPNIPLRKLIANPIDLKRLKDAIYQYAGIVRQGETLTRFATSLFDESLLAPRNSIATAEAANMLIIAKLITRAALLRTESRGAHYRADYSTSDDSRFRKRLAVVNGKWSWHEPRINQSSDSSFSPSEQLMPLVLQPSAGDVFAIAQAKTDMDTNQHHPRDTSPVRL